MNTSLRCTFRISACIALIAATPLLRAQSDDWNVAVLDKILAATPADAKVARVGDMEILVSHLRSWRNRLAGLPGAASVFSGTAPKWTNGKVYYMFQASLSASERQAFVDATREWETFADLQFIPRTSEPNYILVEEVPGLSGGTATVGMVGGQQTFKIGPTSWNRATLCHELGHTLGMVHEHQRSDRDSYITILTGNIIAGQEDNFVKLTDSQNLGSYDFLSIMQYARSTFSVDPDNLNTIEPLPAYSAYLNILGDGDPILTPGDRTGMVAAYGAATPISNVVTNTMDSGLGTLRAALYYGFDNPGTTITFNIPVTDPGYAGGVFTLQPTDALPGLSRATTIDGSSQPGDTNPNGPEIALNGAQAQTPSVYAHGLHLLGTNCGIHSLIINGFEGYGVLIEGTNATVNTVSGCYVGINASGTGAITSGRQPICIEEGSTSNIIGGFTASERNVISGSIYQGIIIRNPGTRYNQVLGNFIGLNGAGTAPIPNTWSGVDLSDGAQYNIIGGTMPGSGNVISGNLRQGITVSGMGTDGNLIVGNTIGLNPAGTAAIANGWPGVDVFEGAQSTVIGGSVTGTRNVISGNSRQGVLLNGVGVNNTLLQGNLIGLNASGTSAIANGWSGVQIANGAASNVVGGTLISMRNIISGNGNHGLSVSDSGSDGNQILGNYLGVNEAGTATVPNGWAGVSFQAGARDNTVGGSSNGSGNVISGNSNQGVSIFGLGTDGNRVQGNLIGLNAAGTTALPNNSAGVTVSSGATQTLVGGNAGARNFISGNGQQGILIGNSGTSGNLIRGNTIGLNAFHTASVPNGSTCLSIYGGASGNQIGGLTPSDANLMTGSPSDSIQFQDAETVNNSVRGNSIYGTVGRAIGLYSSANNDAAAPALTSAVMTTNLTVSGTLNSTPNTTFALDFYSSPTPTSGQGQTYLGSANVNTTGAGTVIFNLALPAIVSAGQIITATATDPNGNTSSMAWGASVSLTSSVNDGIPDAWRAAKFGGSGMTTNALSCTTCDPDNDSADNGHEFRANTNPNLTADVLHMDTPGTTENDVQVSFDSALGVTYRLWALDALGSSARSILADQIIGTGATIQATDPEAARNSNGFYQVQVLP